jgi:hypothetical protein
VLDISLSPGGDQAASVLRIEWSRQSESPANGVPLFQEPAVLHLGFLYLAHEVGRISMAQLLLRAGQYSDGCGSNDVPECAAFYLLLNEIEGRGRTQKSDRPLIERVSELFDPLAAEARSALRHLPGSPATG